MIRLLAAVLLTASGRAAPQPCPVKPVTLIVPFAPGGGSDVSGRFIAQKLSTALGQQVVVENRAGAGGLIGVEAGIKSPPDGYTLTLLPSSYTAYPSVYKLKFDPISDLAPIIQISQEPLLVVVHPALPVNTLQELVALAKSRPGKAPPFSSPPSCSQPWPGSSCITCLTRDPAPRSPTRSPARPICTSAAFRPRCRR